MFPASILITSKCKGVKFSLFKGQIILVISYHFWIWLFWIKLCFSNQRAFYLTIHIKIYISTEIPQFPPPSVFEMRFLTSKTEKHFREEATCPVTWGYHDFVFLWSDSEKSQVVLGVDVPDRALGFHGQLVEKACILNRCGVVQGCSDWNACDEI